jgi:hypothetical protein
LNSIAFKLGGFDADLFFYFCDSSADPVAGICRGPAQAHKY